MNNAQRYRIGSFSYSFVRFGKRVLIKLFMLSIQLKMYFTLGQIGVHNVNSYEKTPTFFYYNTILNIHETQSLRNLSYTIFILQYLQILPQASRTYRWMILVCDAFAKPLVSVDQTQSVTEKYAVCTV